METVKKPANRENNDFPLFFEPQQITVLSTGSPSSLFEPQKQHNMESNYKGLYGIFYKISMEVVKSENSKWSKSSIRMWSLENTFDVVSVHNLWLLSS